MHLCYLVDLDVIVFSVLNFVTLIKKKKGLVRQLQLSCTVCLYSHTFFTLSPRSRLIYRRKKRRTKTYDANVGAIFGCRQVGVAHENLKKLCCYLNMPEPMLSNNNQNILLKLKESAERVAEKSMSLAVSKLRGAADSANVSVSVDRTSQRTLL